MKDVMPYMSKANSASRHSVAMSMNLSRDMETVHDAEEVAFERRHKTACQAQDLPENCMK